MNNALRERVLAWAEKRQGRDSDPVVLARRRIYILPTRQGLVFGALLIAMLLGSMNYSSSLGFILTFFLAALGFVAMHHTHRNLEGLEIGGGHAAPVFAGDEAAIPLLARNHAGIVRGGIALDNGQETQEVADIHPDETVVMKLRTRTTQRGWYKPRRFGLHTTYPFGLFRAWTWVRMDIACLVYPAPADFAGTPPPTAIDNGNNELQSAGQEDFSGLRGYIPGDAPRHVAWRASARSDGDLLVKDFRGGGAASHRFDWEMTRGEGRGKNDTEARLARLVRWVMDARANGESWSLRLPGIELALDGSEVHYQRCLRALALHALPARDDA